jgi:hypothetical protein
MDIDMEEDMDSIGFRVQISDIGSKFSPISFILSNPNLLQSDKYWRFRYQAQFDSVHHGCRTECPPMLVSMVNIGLDPS